MSLLWYIRRLQTFSAKEILYRGRQRFRTHVLDFFRKKNPLKVSLPDSEIIDDPNAHFFYPIFESRVDIFKPIDWHLDLQSQKKFPKKFAHKIDIRSGASGSAKHVWEVNRLSFMLYIARLYAQKKEQKFLDLFFYHLASWKNENAYLFGVNWYSCIEVNLRLIGLFYCWKVLNIEALRKENPSVESRVKSIWLPLIEEHAEYSFKHPSFYSSANNHLISEYAGLFIAALTWEIPHRKSRLAYAKKGLEREILLQNSPEGVNREEAAEYIQFIDDFFLIVAIAAQGKVQFSAAYEERLHAMAKYLNAFLDCEFNYPMYGDGDDGFVLRPDAGGHFNNFKSLLTSFAVYFKDASLKRAGLSWDEKNELLLGNEGKEIFDSLEASPIFYRNRNYFFKDSGHFIFKKSEETTSGNTLETYLHFDCAPLGYLSIAAHGHADALSFILHVNGQPVLIDPGTFTYHTEKKLRSYFVSTRAHNTLCVNGKNQAKQAGPTLWLSHYKTKVLLSDENLGEVEATHDGYTSEGVSHIRKIRFDRARNEFTLTDSIRFLKPKEIHSESSPRPVSVEIPFHLHPAIQVSLSKNSAKLSPKQISKNPFRVEITFDEKLSYELFFDGLYSEHFGKKQDTQYLSAKCICESDIEWTTQIKIIPC